MPHQDFFTDSRPADNRTKISTLTMYRGDTLSFKIVLKSNGCPVDITGGYFWFTAKCDLNDADAAARIQKESGAGITILNPLLGQLLIVLDPIDTNGLALEEYITYYWDLQYQDNSGVVRTIFIGKLTILQDVTRNVGFNIGGFSTTMSMITTSAAFTAGVNPIQEGSAFLDERQQINVNGASAGTFTLTVEDPANPGNFETTTPLPWNATAAAIELALETDITFIDDVTTTGAVSLDLGTITINFDGPLVANLDFSLMVMDVTLLS